MNASNTGTPALPFAKLFADTVATHGAEWARKYYRKHGMQAWEFEFWHCACARRIINTQARQMVTA